MFSKPDFSFSVAFVLGLVVLGASTAAAAKYPTSYSATFDGSPVQTCPALPPDQVRIVKPMPQDNPCENVGTALVALSRYHLLFLCENGQPVDNYDIALGSRGMGKTSTDDRKTPVGSYSLGKPRPSDKFGIFIPVNYPTKAQRAKGFTGEAIGIHGPARDFRCVGFLNVVFDWTAGCVAVADDGYIARIAKWVKAHPKAVIHIR